MTTRKAIVLRMEGRAAIVKVGAGGGCGRCAEAGGCGSDVLGKLFGGRCTTYAVETDRRLSAGEEVDVAVRPRAALQAAAVAYGVPLLTLMGGAALGATVGDTQAVVGALAGLLSGMVLAAFVARRMAAAFSVRVVEPSAADGAGESSCD